MMWVLNELRILYACEHLDTPCIPSHPVALTLSTLPSSPTNGDLDLEYIDDAAVTAPTSSVHEDNSEKSIVSLQEALAQVLVNEELLLLLGINVSPLILDSVLLHIPSYHCVPVKLQSFCPIYLTLQLWLCTANFELSETLKSSLVVYQNHIPPSSNIILHLRLCSLPSDSSHK